MAIKRYTATKDNTITNSYKNDLTTRASGSNMGAADILEVFSIYGQQTTSSAELSRTLIQFPIDTISSDRTAGTLPASGSVSFYLRMFNARHSEQLPKNFTFNVLAVSQSWDEGSGLDMEGYTDETNDNMAGSNWINRLTSTKWGKIGGDYHSSSYTAGASMPNYTVDFVEGHEDIELDVTAAVEEWLATTQDNYGFGVFLTSSYEAHTTASDSNVLHNATGVQESYYTKRFFSRSSEFFFKKPTIEARWDSTRKDERGEIMYSSSLAGVNDNLNTIYLYNYVRGRLSDIPSIGTNAIYVSFYSGSDDNSEPSGQAASSSAATRAAIQLPTTLPHTHVSSINPYVVTGAHVSTGIYKATFAITGARAPLTKIFDVWHDGTGKNKPWTGVEYVTASILPTNLSASQTVAKPVYYINITNLRGQYVTNETARFNLFVRNKDWSPTIYTVANSTVETTTIHSASYRVFRVIDALEAVSYGTGSDAHTVLSHYVSGNYFDFDMSLLDPGYEYAFKFSFYDSAMSSWSEQPELFKFRVIDNEY